VGERVVHVSCDYRGCKAKVLATITGAPYEARQAARDALMQALRAQGWWFCLQEISVLCPKHSAPAHRLAAESRHSGN
jgi:hypothetical protein